MTTTGATRAMWLCSISLFSSIKLAQYVHMVKAETREQTHVLLKSFIESHLPVSESQNMVRVRVGESSKVHGKSRYTGGKKRIFRDIFAI